ncbi:cupin-like domain-containing protein [Roseateles chitosanitabidus]|uniref:cupin-like domain-containing protein n=1 Tax=Roseateles chitosanitabidus TaxID=65048 RepID=UPI000831DCC6|nr:cupin-like domain-containing protein [Roseateles chitosanitabidus]MBO9685957.1 cupin-like domain-containing protein [Roseateles chitosanitabidus]
MKPIREIAATPGRLPDDLLSAAEPVVLRGVVSHWPAVQASRRSDRAAVDYLRQCWRGEPVAIMTGAPEIDGRFFYNDDFSGFNFGREDAPLPAVMEALLELRAEPRPPCFYVGSTTVDTCLPGFRAHNDLDVGDPDALVSVWLGNRSRIAAHYDLPDNVACVMAGHRRFTLFPPEQLPNLYVGPLDFTPAGQPVSLVDLRAPDLARFPRFEQAAAHGLEAVLGPGDAVYIPSMWWHSVEALDGFNVLINYWWRQSPAHMDSPVLALMLALLTMRDLPPAQRRAWQGAFDHYVFAADADTAAHIPEHARHALAPLSAEGAGHLRAHLIQRLRR